jgi:hypothetical protein
MLPLEIESIIYSYVKELESLKYKEINEEIKNNLILCEECQEYKLMMNCSLCYEDFCLSCTYKCCTYKYYYYIYKNKQEKINRTNCCLKCIKRSIPNYPYKSSSPRRKYIICDDVFGYYTDSCDEYAYYTDEYGPFIGDLHEVECPKRITKNFLKNVKKKIKNLF